MDNLARNINELTKTLRNTQLVWVRLEPNRPWVKGKIKCGKELDRIIDGSPRLQIIVNIPPTMGDVVVDETQIARYDGTTSTWDLTKRVIAGPDHDNLYPGIVADTPSKFNDHRYLLLMDDSSAQYAKPENVFPIVAQSRFPWLDGYNYPVIAGFDRDNSIEGVRKFFLSWPKKNLFKFKMNEKFDIEKNGKREECLVVGFDQEVVIVKYKKGREESIYRGSDRIRDIVITTSNFSPVIDRRLSAYFEASQELVKKGIALKETAKKSLMKAPKKSDHNSVVTLRGPIVDEHFNDVDEIADDSHKCTEQCLMIEGIKTEKDVKDIVEEFRDVTDLRVPMLLGWKRLLTQAQDKRGNKTRMIVTYEAPCGKFFYGAGSLRWYLVNLKSKFDIDYFCFDKDVLLNREIIEKVNALYYNPNIAEDRVTKRPLERKLVSAINTFKNEGIEKEFKYSEKTVFHPSLAATGFTLNEEFKSGCDCANDCNDRVTCACHRLNEEHAGLTTRFQGTLNFSVNYNHKRLHDQVLTGIFECNSNCSCSSKCPNRVVQNGIRVRLQIQKTLAKGWGVFALDDIPKGAYLSTYAAQLLDDADQVGACDMYLADLDYISVNQRNKEVFSDNEDDEDEGFGNEISNPSKNPVIQDRPIDSATSMGCTSKEEPMVIQIDCSDDESGATTNTNTNNNTTTTNNNNTRYPKRVREKRKLEQLTTTNLSNQVAVPASKKPELRVRDGRFKNIHDLLGSRDYTLDSRFVGNLGRFFNHSCDPNCFVQSVFINTHDLRLPEVAFFAKRPIRAMEEITWNYNYEVDSLPGRKIQCHCNSLKCVGRIL